VTRRPAPFLERPEDVADKVAENDWFGRLARWGLAVRGLMYLLIALLAVRVAAGDADERADKQGALQAVVRQPLGKVLVAALAVGFAGYAAWRLVAAVRGPTGEKDGRKATFKRIGYAARGLFYLFVFATAVRLIVVNTGDSASEQAPDWTARVMGWPGGRFLVAATGVAIIGGGLYVGWRGVSRKFRKHLKGYEMTPTQQRVILWLGTVGNMARSLIFMLIGVLLVVASLQHDPTEAVGIDGALRRLAGRSFGPLLLSAVAVGLATYGLFSLAEARFRRVESS
jgi:hypothetical protein